MLKSETSISAFNLSKRMRPESSSSSAHAGSNPQEATANAMARSMSPKSSSNGQLMKTRGRRLFCLFAGIEVLHRSADACIFGFGKDALGRREFDAHAADFGIAAMFGAGGGCLLRRHDRQV